MRLLVAFSPLFPLFTLLLLQLTQPTYALHESDVGVVDWHKHLIGVPLANAVVTAPSFVDVDLDGTETGIGSNGTKTVIVTATGNNVLAVLDPEDGAVLWRHIFDAEDRIAGYYKSSTTLATLSGPGGSTLRTFSLLTGSLLLERRLHHPTRGALLEPAHLGKQVVFGREEGDADGNKKEILYVLTNGCEVRKLDAQSGAETWVWKAPDQGSLTIYSDILLSPSSQTLHLIGLSSSTASFTLHTTALSTSSGEVIDHLSGGVPSSISDPLSQFLVARTSSSSSNSKDSGKSVILWLSKSSLYYLPLPSSSSKQFKPRPQALKNSGPAALERLIDVGLSKEGHVVVGRNDGSSFVLRVRESEGEVVGVESVWEFEGSAASPTQADSLYSGGLDARGAPAIGRVWWDHGVQKASADVYAVQSESSTQSQTEAKRPFAFDFDTRSHGVLSHVALDGPRDSMQARVLITTTTGAVQLWSSPSSAEEPVLHWTREEALAATVVAEFVELPEGGKGGDGSAREREEGFLERLSRQVVDAQDFPQYLVNFIKRFTSSPAPAASTVAINYRALSNAATPPSAASPLSTTSLARDAFGHRQLLITATLFGKIYAIDSASGAIVWSRVLGMGWVGRAGMGGRVVPVKLFVVRAVGDEAVIGDENDKAAKGDPEVVLVGQRRADNSLVDTVVFHINALTGDDVRPASQVKSQSASDILAELGVETQGEGEETEKEEEKEDDGGILEGEDVISGPVVEAYLLNAEGRKIVVLLDEFLQAYIYPSTQSAQSVFARALPSLSFPLRTHVESRHRIVGHKLALPPKDQAHFKPTAHPTWALSLPPGEEVQALVPQAPTMGHAKGSGVANIGKVLGSRQTLYKYLDERLFVLKTVARKSRVSAEGNAEVDVVCGVYVVDSAKGTVVYHAEVKASPPLPPSEAPGPPGSGAGAVKRGGCDIKTNLVENWLVYHYYEGEVAGGSVGGAKGYRMVSVEFYEGQKADDKIESSSLSAYSNDTLNYSVYEQAYVFPSAITALATTTTKFGITSKDLIVATANRKIQSFPRRIFDPRRPSRKTTAEEQEEFLIQYDPLIPNDPKRALSHNYNVANVQKIITSPALLESTSLVFAYGLDMFLTRVTPSNTFDVLSENFNKLQLVLTVTGLLVAILITRPMVKRKSLKEKWYN